MDGVHDMGGMHGFEGVVVPGGGEVFHAAWEPRVFAVHVLVGIEKLGAGPGGRPTREEMPPAEYLEASYYERWLWSAERRLERKGTIAPGEVERMMDRLAGGESLPRHEDPDMRERALADLNTRYPMDAVETARFAPGDRVRVHRMRPRGHTRCPRYARGAVGEVKSIRGADAMPDRSVYGEKVAPEPVYSVGFESAALWGESEEPPFTVLLDLWESYLEPA
jgi:nitrile hydratase subunit beta